ncbi:hypothetical protein THMIRHAS_20190 [Thiosulfatimonas sediminis]|uniref:Uncharacterized protein n=1 Tax=Thiosulfatimonas sediminis TaxID=2675054 RepID=A0A6F8PX25_9GAMM|nr:hypothetical protein [Thiosulfatimonas sediminis]BBP46646.1 hypothetical protein THMIRHAS_20190 [Thiosulfatimonas sediminis]
MSLFKNQKTLQRQRGAISILGVGAIFAALFAFDLVMTYTKLKIVDRELDNYARSVAEVAIRSELALTRDGLAAGTMALDSADKVTNFALERVGYSPAAGELDTAGMVINKMILFGNFASDGTFYPLGESNPDYPESVAFGAYKTNPRLYIQEMINEGEGSEKTIAKAPRFDAVAVQLWTDDNFYGFVPQGRALYGAGEDNPQCFCDTRYEQCLSADLTAAEIKAGIYPDEPPALLKNLLGSLIGGGVAEHSLSSMLLGELIANTIASEIAVPNSSARKNYCEYGYTASHPLSFSNSKYPYMDFTTRQAWIGIDPVAVDNGVLGNLLAESNFSKEDFARATKQLPVFIYDGADTLSNQAGLLSTVDELLGLLNPDSSGSIYAKETNATNTTSNDDLNASERSYYRCSLLTANVDVSLLAPLTDSLGLSQEGVAQNCDGLLSSVGGLLNSVLDIVTGDEESCGFLGLGCLLGSVFNLLDPLVGPVLDLIGIGDLETVLNDLLDPVVLVHDPVYIGRSGTCTYGTDNANISSTRCLYNANDAQFQSCRYMLSGLPDSQKPTLVNRLSIALSGPVKDFSSAVETLNCELKNFRFVQPPFEASYWQEVN